MIRETLQLGSGGHLSDIALSALADGQDKALSPSTHQHLESCDHCQARFADAVLEHAAVCETMQLAPQREAQTAVPWRWILTAAASLLVLRGGVALERLRGAPRDLAHARRVVPLALRSLVAEAPWFLGMMAAAMAVVLVVALAAWVAPRAQKV